jgi:hypothetical protein
MLKRWLHRLFLLMLIAGALVFAGWVGWSLAQYCDEKNGAETASQKKPFEIPWPGSAGWTAIFTGLLTVSTIGLWLVNRGLLNAAIAQSADTTKSAVAMASVAASMAENVTRLKEAVDINRQIADRQKSLGEAQLRAYVNGSTGPSVYQDRPNKLRFRGAVNLTNTGPTPAHKVVHRVNAGILPVVLPQPQDFVLLLAAEDTPEIMIPPHSLPIGIGFTIPDYIDDAAVENIKRGAGTHYLYVWGLVGYEDAFGEKHETRFCQAVTWIPTTPKETPNAFFIPGRNKMT